MQTEFVRHKANGKEYVFKFKEIRQVRCPQCEVSFKTIWPRRIYCGRACYLKGITERNTQWRQTTEGRAYTKKHNSERPRDERTKALAVLGNKCATCGYNDTRALHIDHVFNDGFKERNIRKTIYRKIANREVDLSRYQALCANCNWIKRLENK